MNFGGRWTWEELEGGGRGGGDVHSVVMYEFLKILKCKLRKDELTHKRANRFLLHLVVW